jgi:hypothetical protein
LNVYLRESGDYEAETLYISSQSVEYGGNNYEPRLRGEVNIRQTLGGATDGGAVPVDNTDFEMGLKFVPRERFVDGSQVEIYKAFRVAGTVYADKVMDCVIYGPALSMANNSVTLNLVGDFYDPNKKLGAFPLAQRCVHRFNKNGTLSPAVDPCGWQTFQGGDPLHCGKTQDDCISHNNLHRIGAIPFFANVTVTILSGDESSSGIPTGGSYCFTSDTPVLLPTGETRRIGEFAHGDLVMSFNPATGELEEDRVEKVFINTTNEILRLIYADGVTIDTRPEHPFFIEPNVFIPARDLIAGNDYLCFDGDKFKYVQLVEKQEIKLKGRVEVRNLSVRKNQTFIVSGRGVHNKALDPTYPINL